MTPLRASPLVRFVRFAALAIVLPAVILAVLGYHSLRQWHRSADELFREREGKQRDDGDVGARLGALVTLLDRAAADG